MLPASGEETVPKRTTSSSAPRAWLVRCMYHHLIPLELGGDPNDPRNLWVEPPSPGHTPSQGFRNPKDGVEHKAKRTIHEEDRQEDVIYCTARTSLITGRRLFANDSYSL